MTDQPTDRPTFDPPALRLQPDGGWSYGDPPTSSSSRPEDTTVLPRIPAPPEDDQPVEPSSWDYEIAGATGLPVDVVMTVLDAVEDRTEPEAPPSLRSRVWNRMWQGAAVATIALWSGFLGTMTAHMVAQVVGWWS